VPQFIYPVRTTKTTLQCRDITQGTHKAFAKMLLNNDAKCLNTFIDELIQQTLLILKNDGTLFFHISSTCMFIPEKILRNFGTEPEEFTEDKLLADVEELRQPHENDPGFTEGIFAPWAFYKKDFQEINGHDPLYAPQSKEDSDLFNRFVLNGYDIIQSWDALVYHFTSRGSRFNKHSGGAAGKNSEEWLHTTNKNMRNFIRKWGTPVLHDSLMKPIIPPKYNIGIEIVNCQPQLLEFLEPWCDILSVDLSQELIESYVSKEESNTTINLRGKINVNKESEIKVRVNGKLFNQQDYQMIQQLPQIIQQSGTLGEFKLGNLELVIQGMTEYQSNLIKS